MSTATSEVTHWQLHTRFGAFEAERQDIINFVDGIPGFEGCHQFVLIASEQLAPLQCLQAVEAPYPSFLVIDPALIDPAYTVVLGVRDEARLGRAEGCDPSEESLVQFVIVTSADAGATVNLRAPIVINTSRMAGCQLIPEDSPYSVSHPLAG